jgi:hypothetical protein
LRLDLVVNIKVSVSDDFLVLKKSSMRRVHIPSPRPLDNRRSVTKI